MMEFAVGHKFEGGLALMLPGKYYRHFKEAQARNLLNPNNHDDLSFDTIIKKFLREFRTDDYIKSNEKTPKIAYTLLDYFQIDNSTFRHLSKLRFGVDYCYNLENTFCPFCKVANITADHITVCKLTANSRNTRHNNIVAEIARQMNEERRCNVVCVQNQNMNNVRDKPDLEFFDE